MPLLWPQARLLAACRHYLSRRMCFSSLEAGICVLKAACQSRKRGSYCGDAPSFGVPTQKFVFLVSRVRTNLHAHTQQVPIFFPVFGLRTVLFWRAMAAIPVVSADTHFVRLAYTANTQLVCLEPSLICKSGFFSIFPNKLLFTSRSMNMCLWLKELMLGTACEATCQPSRGTIACGAVAVRVLRLLFVQSCLFRVSHGARL